MSKYHKTLVISLSIVAILVGLVLPVASVSAATGVGVSPGVIRFTDVYSGGSSQKQIQIMNYDDSPMEITITKSGTVATWISFTPTGTITVPAGSSATVTIKVQPPSGTAAGTYDGQLQVKATIPDHITGGAGAQIVPGVVVPVTIGVTSTANKSLSLTSVEIDSVVYGEDLEIDLVINNTGNVAAAPDVKVEIMDAEQTTVIKTHEETLASIDPGVSATPTVSISSSDLTEQTNYWATVTVTLDGETIGQFSKTFDILKEGEVACILYLSAITSPSFIGINEEAEINALVTNTGPANVDAQFIGTVTNSKGDLVATLTSSIVSIPTQTQGSLTVFFDPDKAGDYIIGGNVYYSVAGNTTLADCSLFKTALLSVYDEDSASCGWQLRDWFFLGAIILLSLLVLILLMQGRESSGRGGGGFKISRNY